MFEEPISVTKDQVATGCFTVKPHPNAPRHLFITLDATVGNSSVYRCFDF
jgi:hypothetical protein